MSVKPYAEAMPYAAPKPYTPLCDDEPDLWDELLDDETLDDLNLEPLSFLETAEMMQVSMVCSFDLCVRSNRLSVNYLDKVFQYVKVVKECAGLSVTKAVLEQDGGAFPTLEHIETDYLYFITSAIFRKTHEAALFHFDNRTRFIQKAFSAELGLYTLLNRLKATEARIRTIHAKGIDSEKILAREHAFSIPVGLRTVNKKADRRPRGAASYPVQKRFLKKKEDKNEPKIQDAPQPKPCPASTPMEKAVNEMKSKPELVKTDFAPGGIPKDSPWLKIFAEGSDQKPASGTKGSASAKASAKQPAQPPEQKQTEKTEQKPEKSPDRKRKKKKRG